MWPTWTLMRNDPDLVGTFRVLWGLSLLVLVLPGPDAHAGSLFTILLATVWGARTGAWVHEDREAGLLDRVQVLTAGPRGSRTRRLLAGFGGAVVGGLSMGLPHSLLGGLVLVAPGSDAAVLTVPLAGLAALAGYGLGTGLHPALGDGTTAAIAVAVPGAAAGYWIIRSPVLLGIPPTMLAVSVTPPAGLEPWSWGLALPAVSVLVPLVVGSVVAVRSPSSLGVDPRWSLLLAPVLLVGLLAGSPGSTTSPADDEGLRRSAVVLLDGRDEIVPTLDAAEPDGTPPEPGRLDPAEVPIRGQRDVVVYLHPAPEPVPSTLRWPGGEAVLDDRSGTWSFDRSPYEGTVEVSLWTATARLERASEYADPGNVPRRLQTPPGYGVFVEASLPFHPAWAVAAGLPALGIAATATRWWGVPDA